MKKRKPMSNEEALICPKSDLDPPIQEVSLTLLADYVEGGDCTCAAHGEYECACGADWTPKIEKLVEAWRDMPADEMRLRCGEMTAQEIRTVRAVLNQIIKTKKT